ncbi:MAG: TIGR03084 family protein [Ilumatobacteraceae bacterium]|nr:TIGR03084 family protein [Ilumatobacteraceae bacterium]
MSTDIAQLVQDLRTEAESLLRLIEPLADNDWLMSTPAPGWCIADQIIHLALFDERALWSMTDPARFSEDLKFLQSSGVDIHQRERLRSHASLLKWWVDANTSLCTAGQGVPTETRCQWYGPSMSATSMVTARVMETWAHAHDVADALSVQVLPTLRLRHIAHIGVRARAFSYIAHRRELPTGEVCVRLNAPDGTIWRWGDDAAHSVSGDALDFCQVVTHRRHINDVHLEIHGDLARDWMNIAQAFAGPPGEGRQPGQFGG